MSMTTTRTSLEVLNELYDLPSPHFIQPYLDMKHSLTILESEPQGPPAKTTAAITLLTYIAPLLCLIFITLLGWAYSCPVIVDNLTAPEGVVQMESKNMLAAAPLVCSAGLITLGMGFVWRGELEEEGDLRI